MKLKWEDWGKEGKRKRRSIRRKNEVRKRGSFEERSQVVGREREKFAKKMKLKKNEERKILPD